MAIDAVRGCGRSTDSCITSEWRAPAALSLGGVLVDGLYIYRDATMLDLIKDAWGVSDDDVAGGPGWISYDLFDIVAKVPADTTAATANLMLQSLLFDRFDLVVRRETRPAPRYFLTVGAKGSKLKPADPSAIPDCNPINLPGPMPNRSGLVTISPVQPLRKISV